MAKIYLKDNPLKSYGAIPTFMMIDGDSLECYDQRTDRHYSDGWRDLVTPEYDEKLQYLGAIIFDSDLDVGTYEVINKTTEQIQTETLQQAQQTQQEAVNSFMKKIVNDQVQEMDDEGALENQSVFPFWADDPIGYGYALNEKRQAFNDEGLLKLYKCTGEHNKQTDWPPKDAHSLWVEVFAGEGIEVWSPRVPGENEPYMKDKQVWYKYEGEAIYQSTIDHNVWEPTKPGSETLWILVNSGKQSAVSEIKTQKK